MLVRGSNFIVTFQLNAYKHMYVCKTNSQKTILIMCCKMNFLRFFLIKDDQIYQIKIYLRINYS